MKARKAAVNGKPVVHPVKADAIPAELRAVPRWVCWRWEQTASGKWTKPPFNVKTGRKADKTDPNCWSTFDEVLAAHQQGRFDGIGFCLTGDGLVGIDLDDCRNPDTGKLTDFAERIIRWANSVSVHAAPS